jgi:hypothetical protein
VPVVPPVWEPPLPPDPVVPPPVPDESGPPSLRAPSPPPAPSVSGNSLPVSPPQRTEAVEAKRSPNNNKEKFDRFMVVSRATKKAHAPGAPQRHLAGWTRPTLFCSVVYKTDRLYVNRTPSVEKAIAFYSRRALARSLRPPPWFFCGLRPRASLFFAASGRACLSGFLRAPAARASLVFCGLRPRVPLWFLWPSAATRPPKTKSIRGGATVGEGPSRSPRGSQIPRWPARTPSAFPASRSTVILPAMTSTSAGVGWLKNPRLLAL